MKKQAAFCLGDGSHASYLLLDEPVDGLDPIVRHKLRRYLMDDVADREMTVLVSRTTPRKWDISNYIGILAKGRMVFEGATFGTPANLA